MPVRIVHRLDRGAVRKLLTSPQGGVARDMLRRGLRVETAAKRNLAGAGGPKRIDTGRLRASVSTELVTVGGAPAARVGTNVGYAMWVHEGTGIYGPTGAPIRPRSGKYLKFWVKAGGSVGLVFAREVKGMQPNPFLRNALSAARR